jgi:hypothetical protein
MPKIKTIKKMPDVQNKNQSLKLELQGGKLVISSTKQLTIDDGMDKRFMQATKHYFSPLIH